MAREQTYQANPDWSEAQKRAFHRAQRGLTISIGYVGKEIPILDNHTDAQVVDEVGALKQARKVVDKAEKAHVERLKARMGEADDLSGEEYVAQYRGSKRIILNQEKCKEVIEEFDEEGIHLERLLAAIKAGQIKCPSNVFLNMNKTINEDTPESELESNYKTFHTTAAGGRSLYVEPIE